MLGEIDKAGGTTLMERAKQKAEEELAAEFNYALLCTQGKQLSKMVLLDKAKRIHNKKTQSKEKGLSAQQMRVVANAKHSQIVFLQSK